MVRHLEPSTLPDPVDSHPAFWPSSLSPPLQVLDAREALASANAAWRERRLALETELVLEPQLGVMARDDPPRPAEARAQWQPSATVAWSPLRSETLLSEARVLEAEAAYAAAWREAWSELDQAPVERARAAARLAQAEHAWNETANGDADDLERREAQLDLEEARFDLRRFEDQLEASFGSPEPFSLPAERRHDHPDPRRPQVTATWRYRARALRLAADVARSERRWTAAVVPLLELEVGYAGSDAQVGAELELRGGRPTARAYASLGGTPQERGWATLSAAFRFGNDQPAVRAGLDAARLAEVRTLAELEEHWNGRALILTDELAFARERWRLEEDRLAAEAMAEAGAEAEADVSGQERTLDRVRRAYLRFLRAYDALCTQLEAWPPAGDAPSAT